MMKRYPEQLVFGMLTIFRELSIHNRSWILPRRGPPRQGLRTNSRKARQHMLVREEEGPILRVRNYPVMRNWAPRVRQRQVKAGSKLIFTN